MSFEIRTIEPGEIEEFSRCQSMAFGRDHRPEYLPARVPVFEFDRNLAAFDGVSVVGTAGIFSFRMGVPGGSLPTAGVTMVSVRPTHRRKGILTRLMAAQLDQVAQRGEPLAALWASESGIYGRFGYGLAAEQVTLTLPRDHARFATPVTPAGSFHEVSAAEVARTWPAAWHALVERHPGFVSRSDGWWQRVLADVPAWRDGYTASVYLDYLVDGERRGCLRYRTKDGWTDRDIPAGKVKVEELLALDGEAYRALWQYVFGVDLVDTITAPYRRVDEPLYYQLADPRRLERAVRDGIWVRIIDVPAALSGRRYAVDGRLVIEIADRFRPATSGVYVLEGGPAGATCSRADAAPDLSMDITDLGASYLGGTRLATLAEAGRVRGSADAVRLADTMFQSSTAPWCPMMF